MENTIIIDWLTFTDLFGDVLSYIALLGLSECDWKMDSPSSLRYAYRAEFGSISIHYTPASWSGKRNPGICVELTGQGCREFETYGTGDFESLFRLILDNPDTMRCSRVDLAYDDFYGKIPLDQMSLQAMRLQFTSRLRRRSVICDCPDGDLDHDGVTVTHGSRSSRIFVRCYDKRVERSAYELSHWVRLEIQCRSDDAMGVIQALQSNTIGTVFAGILQNYLVYRDPKLSDSHKYRWPVSDWWSALIGEIEPIQIHQKKDVEYNRDRLESYIYGQCKYALKTAMALDGVQGVFEKLTQDKHLLPHKYRRLLDQEKCGNDDILRAIGVYKD